nr:MAG TPA: hypothetical protein [Caudoviricetes sp.]
MSGRLIIKIKENYKSINNRTVIFQKSSRYE